MTDAQRPSTALDQPADAAPDAGPEATRARLDGAFAGLYDELCIIARARLRRTGAQGATSTGALVHECWLRLERAGRVQVGERGRFLALVSQVMRSTIVDLVRRSRAQMRGGDAEHLTLDTGVAESVAGTDHDDVLAIDDALGQLAQRDQRAAQVVEMRYFAGLDDAAIAQALQVSERTVRRDWDRARAFLALALRS
jgi:RNA polymerase sigma factor (TIGR02999 family)